MSITRTLITSAAAVLVMVAAFGTSEAAQRSGAQKHHNNDSMQNSGGGVRHVDKKRGPRISKNRHHNRYVRSRKGSGIFIGLGESSRCAYSHRKWRATSSRYWRSRYYDCLSG
jgi:Ni/Co efflux regulator RcnB